MLDSQSRGLVFKTTGWLQGQLSLSFLKKESAKFFKEIFKHVHVFVARKDVKLKKSYNFPDNTNFEGLFLDLLNIGIQQDQSYLMGRRCLFSLGWLAF